MHVVTIVGTAICRSNLHLGWPSMCPFASFWQIAIMAREEDPAKEAHAMLNQLILVYECE